MFRRIGTTHSQFQGRAIHFGGLSASAKTPYLPGASEYMIDLNGHGTHTAGTIGGYQSGVAPYANIINVKAFDMNQKGNLFLVMKAIEDITTDFAERKRVFDGTTDWQFRGGIINMSWGMKGTSAQLEVVAEAAKQAGILLIAAAGNSAQDALAI
jgi:subtilisin family serine protease